MNKSGNWIDFFFKEKITLKQLGHPTRGSAFNLIILKGNVQNIPFITHKVNNSKHHVYTINYNLTQPFKQKPSKN